MISLVSLVCLLVLLISTGPTIQYYIVAFIKNDPPSIYGSAYKNNIAPFPALRDWLLESFRWQFILIAFIGASFSLLRASALQIFLRSAFGFFIILSSADILIAVVTNNWTATFIFENILVNAIGAPVIAVIMIVVLAISDFVFVNVQGREFTKHIAASSVIAIIGLVISCASYYATRFFYEPLPIALDVVLQSPVSGSIGVPTKEAAEQPEKKAFQFFPRNVSDATLSWRGDAGGDGFHATIAAPTPKDQFDVVLKTFVDCIGDEYSRAGKAESNELRISAVSNFDINIQGFAEVSTSKTTKLTGKLTTKLGDLTFFWLDVGKKGESTKLTQFSEENSALDLVQSEQKEIEFYIEMPLLSGDEKKVQPSSREIKLTADARNVSIKFEKPPINREKGRCAAVKPSASPKDENQLSFASAKDSGLILVRVVPINSKATSTDSGSHLHFAGLNGWVAMTVPKASGPISDDGVAEFLLFRGNVSSLDADGQSISTKPTDQLFAFGRFRGGFEEGDQLRFAGAARSLKKNDTRINNTRWEKLDWEQQKSGLLVIFAGLTSVLTLAVRLIGSNRSMGHQFRIGLSDNDVGDRQI